MIDVQMLNVTEGGKERPVAELERLLTRAGLNIGQVRHTATEIVLVEAHPQVPPNRR
jgi:hypothetical protein